MDRLRRRAYRGVMPKTSTPRPLYSQRFLEKYGRNLKREEIRLVQGYRGLPAPKQAALLALVSSMIVDGAREAEDAALPYAWQCDDPRVTNQKGGA
jgi:hypothetical protein